MSIEANAAAILAFLYPKGAMEFVDGKAIASATNLQPADINDAAEVLESNGYVELRKYLDTDPFRFGLAAITSHGRFAEERAQAAQVQKETVAQAIKRMPDPVGSPFGFEDEDWEYISSEKESTGKLKVVMGYAFISNHYDTALLQQRIETAFNRAVTAYNADPRSIKVKLAFLPLAAGFGEHVFNEIARDIISADVAVFDTSDLNPNVMLEMGVALTWGTRVLPIRNSNCPPPPSDISGQTWATYEPGTSGGVFTNQQFHLKLSRMVTRAAQKKAR